MLVEHICNFCVYSVKIILLWVFLFHSITPFFVGGDNSQSNILKSGDEKKKNAWGVLNNSCHRYLPEGLALFLVNKDFVK